MGETDTLRGDSHRGEPGAGEADWAGRGFRGLGEVKTSESSHWRCLTCPEARKGTSRSAAEQHAETERHLVLYTATTAFIPAERYAGGPG